MIFGEIGLLTIKFLTSDKTLRSIESSKNHYINCLLISKKCVTVFYGTEFMNIIIKARQSYRLNDRSRRKGNNGFNKL